MPNMKLVCQSLSDLQPPRFSDSPWGAPFLPVVWPHFIPQRHLPRCGLAVHGQQRTSSGTKNLVQHDPGERCWR